MSSETSTIVFNDFSPGIYQSRYESAVASTQQGPPPRGAASITNTYRCGAGPDGALGPLPRRTPTTFTNSVRGSTAGYVAGMVEVWNTDALVDSQISTVDSAIVDGTAAVMSHSWLMNDGDTPVGFHLFAATTFYQDQQVFGTPYTVARNQTDIYFNVTGQVFAHPEDYRINVGLLARGASTYPLAPVPLDPLFVQPIYLHTFSFFGPGLFGVYLKSGGTAFSVAELAMIRDTAVTAGGRLGTAAVNSGLNVMYYPEQAAVGSSFTVSAANTFLPAPLAMGTAASTQVRHLVYHQGRAVTVLQLNANFALTNHGRPILYYMSPYRVKLNDSPGYVVPGEESSTGYGAVASMNANELVMFAHDGGALVIRGDLASPVLTSLPMVEGTYNVECVPAVTPLGVVYLSRNGVFAWNGRDSSKKLSGQIDGDLTDYATTVPRLGTRGRLGWWHPWVCCPNNWLHDTRTGGWWRLDDPGAHSVYNCYDVDYNNRMFAFKWRNTVADNVPWDNYDQTVLASDYSWQSLPVVDEMIGEGKDRFDSIGTVELHTERATGGTPTVAVTVTGYNERGVVTGSGTALFLLATSSTSFPSNLKLALNRNVSGAYVQVRIVAQSGSSAVAAPLIRSLILHRRQSARARTDRA